LIINLGEEEDKRCQLLEPKGRVLKSPGASLRFIKNGLDKRKGISATACPLLTLLVSQRVLYLPARALQKQTSL